MRLLLRLVLSLVLLVCPRAVAAQCGGQERWPVKVGSDTGAGLIDLTNVTSTFLHDLTALPRPQLPSDDVTRHSDERTVRTRNGRLIKFKLESGRTGDQDYHLVITGDATADVITIDNREPARTGTFKAWLGGYGTSHTDRLSPQITRFVRRRFPRGRPTWPTLGEWVILALKRTH
jgi:hypothetical protein